jgi:hypothetical protein
MNIYLVKTDIENYRFVTSGMGVEAWMSLGREMRDFAPRGNRWKPGVFFWQNFDKPHGTFFSTGDPMFVGVTYEARRSSKIWQQLEKSGELLPIAIEGYGEALLLRVLNSGEAVDWSKSG